MPAGPSASTACPIIGRRYLRRQRLEDLHLGQASYRRRAKNVQSVWIRGVENCRLCPEGEVHTLSCVGGKWPEAVMWDVPCVDW
jgi:hypothetical protein